VLNATTPPRSGIDDVVLALLIIPFAALLYVATSIRIVNQWEQVVVLTFGKYTAQLNPGFRFVWRGVQTGITIDKRVRTTQFQTAGTLSKDNVPVALLAVLFWQVVDVEKTAFAVREYMSAIDMAAQATLRTIVSQTELKALLADSAGVDALIADKIREKASGWGIEVGTVEIRDLTIPPSLQDLLSREAQARAEKEARRIDGEAEVIAAEQFVEAARLYGRPEIAFNLRALNIMIEAVKSDSNTMMFFPTELVNVLSTLKSTTTDSD
jgi:regulator of protease activity HflC (stomatin/prohibitin superfamily)